MVNRDSTPGLEEFVRDILDTVNTLERAPNRSSTSQ